MRSTADYVMSVSLVSLVHDDVVKAIGAANSLPGFGLSLGLGTSNDSTPLELINETAPVYGFLAPSHSCPPIPSQSTSRTVKKTYVPLGAGWMFVPKSNVSTDSLSSGFATLPTQMDFSGYRIALLLHQHNKTLDPNTSIYTSWTAATINGSTSSKPHSKQGSSSLSPLTPSPMNILKDLLHQYYSLSHLGTLYFGGVERYKQMIMGAFTGNADWGNQEHASSLVPIHLGWLMITDNILEKSISC